MPSTKQILRALQKIGYSIDRSRGKGSHAQATFEFQGKIICWTIVQQARDIPKGTLSSIRRNTCLTEQSDFDKALRCKMTREEYLDILRRSRRITGPQR
jgi:predicted RNA binding protein YcfA (HicA-like mRNA interferase family)